MQKKKLSQKLDEYMEKYKSPTRTLVRRVTSDVKKLEKENEELLAIVEQLFDGKSVIDMDLYTKIDSYLANKE
jgi:ribosome recycling factor